MLDYSPVNYPRYLRDFYAWSNNPAITNVEFLEYAPNLRYLSLDRNQLTSVNGIEQAVNLERFEASNSLIRDLGPLANLKNLKNLYLPNNIIEDVTPLRDLPLVQANLELNKITKVFGRLPDLNSGYSISLDANPISCGDLASYKVRQPAGAEVYFESICVDDPLDLPLCPYQTTTNGYVAQCALGQTSNAVQFRAEDYQGNTFSVRSSGLLQGFELLIDRTQSPEGLADLPLQVHLVRLDSDGKFVGETGEKYFDADEISDERPRSGVFADYKDNPTFLDVSALELEVEVGEKYAVLLHSDHPMGGKRWDSLTSDDNFHLEKNTFNGMRINSRMTRPLSEVSIDHIPQHDLIFTVIVAGEDSDNDGILDAADAFPNDPAASADTDGDGKPDDWNVGTPQRIRPHRLN